MLLFTEWLRGKFLCCAENEQAFVTCLREAFEQHRDEFRGSGIRCHGRLPEIVAWLQMGFVILLLFLKDVNVFSREQVDAYSKQYVSLLYTVARKQARSIEQDKPAHIFVRKLYALIESGQATVLPKSNPYSCSVKGLVAYEDDEFYYLLNDAAHRAVRQLCEDQGELFVIGSRALPKALAEEKLIDCDGGNTRSIRVGGRTVRVVALRKERARQIVEEGTS
jgi:hypothetical protein